MGKPDKLWKTIKQILPSSVSIQTWLLMENDYEHTTPIYISNYINRYFSIIEAP